MLRTRFLTAVVLIPIVFLCIYRGALSFLTLVASFLTLAEIEFCRLVARDGFRPTLAFGLGTVWLFLVNTQLQAHSSTLDLLQPGLALLLLSSLAWQLFHQRSHPVVDWALTMTGGLYLGVCGACIVNLRYLQPDGLWWTLIVIPAIIIADSGAYFFGRAWGQRKLAPILSPHKTWEGYLAGVITSGALTAWLASIWRMKAESTTAISGMHGLTLGILVAVFAPIGDLAISMIKRQVGAKDSSGILPGHGGALDRMDSVLWAAVIGYYYAKMFTPR